MTEGHRRLIDKVTAADFLAGAAGKSLDDLREMREQARSCENEVSFERRLAQARIDILKAELGRRKGEGSVDLIEMLPAILADDRRPPAHSLPDRAPDLSVPRSADAVRRRVDEVLGEETLVGLPDLSDDEIEEIVERLAVHEKQLSARRRRVHEVLDELQGEFVRRFRAGEADAPATSGAE